MIPICGHCGRSHPTDEEVPFSVERDRKAIEALKSAGWSVLVVWECATKEAGTLAQRLKQFLAQDSPN